MSDLVSIQRAELEKRNHLLGVFDKIWQDPEIGERVRKKSKEIDPNITIPDEHPVAVRAMTEIDSLKKIIAERDARDDARNQEDQTRRAEAELRDKLGKVQAKFNLTEKGMDGTLAIMQERQLADPEAAAALYLQSIPKAAPQTAANMLFDTKANMFGHSKHDDAWAQLHTDPDAFFADQVNQVLAETAG